MGSVAAITMNDALQTHVLNFDEWNAGLQQLYLSTQEKSKGLQSTPYAYVM